ncbi:Cytochrome c552 (plasmid) [Sinorhizobium sojae CCBAU 05684]|uniref:Cytochrome c552 n=1 Tax=Sinorhizobium sojae CCBAU 05684 TaxID=716928 RepID=A0A249PHM4_9HYPH|nr:c-type cytochrome [Sinorhizobium sojae]ASY65237.1 Cytochrome c552 [Sinorhizobium sojae CCBAU 05684]
MMNTYAPCLTVALALTGLLAGQSAAADWANGERIAERWCAGCHVVAPGQSRGSDMVPTFAEIGSSKRLDETGLTAFLSDPTHSRMPPLSLARSEISDLVAYIRRQAR